LCANSEYYVCAACQYGLGATGLGCFLDVESVSSFGLEQSGLRTLYHFTVGRVDASNSPRFPAYSYEADMFDLRPSTLNAGDLAEF